jgi:hypothetical protein
VTDKEFMAGFQAGSLSGDQFRHRDHIRAAWLFLERYPLIEALERFAECLQRFAAAKGAPDRYHATITWSFLLLINERRERAGRAQSWSEFETGNAELFDREKNILDLYYDPATINSTLARRTFILPDRAMVPRLHDEKRSQTSALN